MENSKITCYFHKDQLKFKPKYEWAFGYRLKHPESTKRAETIFNSLKTHKSLFDIHEPEKLPLSLLRQTHSARLIALYNTASQLTDSETFYPSVFPKLKTKKIDVINIKHAGCFCYDSGTPLDNKVWQAAFWSASNAYSAAKKIAKSTSLNEITYALSRPPGHHATKSEYGGYCYLNNAAIAAKYLKKKGRVVILDIDFHHGNGTQDLFYSDDEVLTISMHGDPRLYFPFFWGYPEEAGAGKGLGYNMNFVFQKNTDIKVYLKTFHSYVLPAILKFEPKYMIVSAGFDTFKEDPVGGFLFETQDFYKLGQAISKINIPKVVVQEGGYSSKDLGINVTEFFKGLVNYKEPQHE